MHSVRNDNKLPQCKSFAEKRGRKGPKTSAMRERRSRKLEQVHVVSRFHKDTKLGPTIELNGKKKEKKRKEKMQVTERKMNKDFLVVCDLFMDIECFKKM